MYKLFFSVFNELWENSNIDAKPFIYTYKCLPIMEKFGIIQYVPNVKSVLAFNWKILPQLNKTHKEQFICSLAGSVLAAFILGIRNRHQDNMLIKDNHIFFNIDVGGHLWNNGPLLDAPRMAIPTEVRTVALTVEEWNHFEQILLDGFGVLHKSGELITTVSVTLFKKIGNVDIIGEFLRGNNSLMLGLNLVQAQQRLKQMLEQSLTSVIKALKDWGHKLNKSEPNSLEVLQKNIRGSPDMHLQQAEHSDSPPSKHSFQNLLTQPKLSKSTETILNSTNLQNNIVHPVTIKKEPSPNNPIFVHQWWCTSQYLDENGEIRDCYDLGLPYNLH